ncbi:30S ribosomal protein S21 [Candidatus Tremblaya phenacola]|uniref:Small ribosomal subunit protein bS21 n=1 Tax=Candidatus Tremblayella phenacoccinincola TaxID=1010676 RepID=A0A2G0V6U9_9PROT|nr:30S ribosomal protein S21 [Candidatus Tremblaya phenacola]PHN16189.1 30S ribosomal protein S21 [Candidatus Tremblaya phenacola]PHN16356.1 30S ribosomal protein S21 [Candidatus Tremblaya phenacola]
MSIVIIKDVEPFEIAIRRFKRMVERSGLLSEVRSRLYYEKPTSERKRKKVTAARKHIKKS